ncbi:MAG TPA: helix-turn-helix domain-containing protein [Desulfovibrio sp.]|uniref:helix-turn-helix transcriptional regulator n=1 Tax=Desulfovibrio sp. TaxID=885 RepID=UPI002CE2E4FE|nr:helix-turn-helix domain-containing protein [Desulfovibrio sp.]HMM39252.1 helix-turn-helix domain-containing protein [Desulfovibrio sp.]
MDINLLRPADLRARLKICNSTLYALIARGDLPAPKKLGRSSVWRESEIAAALNKLLGEEVADDQR